MSECPTCGGDPCANPSFCRACREADARKTDARKPHTSRWHVYNRNQLRDAPQPTVEALMYSLRERGTKALDEAPTKRRLSELSEQQLHEICGRLQRLKAAIARAWAPEEITILVEKWNNVSCLTKS